MTLIAFDKSARARAKDLFLRTLAETSIVKDACAVSGIDRQTAYNWRESDKEFAASWRLALHDAADVAERAARKRAIFGVKRYKFDSKGNQICINKRGERVPYIEREYSDALLSKILVAHKPELYGDKVKHEVDPFRIIFEAGPWGVTKEIEVGGQKALPEKPE